MDDSAPAPDSLRVEALAAALRDLLPAQYVGRAAEIASLVLALARPGEGREQARARLAADPALGAALASLQGQTVLGGAVGVSFDGAQLGDVAMGDVAGGDIIKPLIVVPPLPERAPPFLVPYDPNPLFQGRERELAELVSLLLQDAHTSGASIVALTGAGGMGKTQLAVEFAYRHLSSFPGGVFWLEMDQEESIAAQVAAAGGPGGLDLPGWVALSFDDRVAAVRRAWSEPARRLLVMDNLEDPKVLQAWRPRGGGARVLITTRRGVWPATTGVRPVVLQSLPRQDSITLLLAPRAANQGYDVADLLADPVILKAADAIADTVGDLPLALAIAGAYLESSPGTTPGHYLARLRAAPLHELALDDDLADELPTGHLADVAATIRLSYDRLDAGAPADRLARQLLERAALLAPSPFPSALLVRLLDQTPDDLESPALVDRVTRRLVALGLGERAGDGPLSIHRLILAFARSTAGSDEPARDAVIMAAITTEGDLPPSAPGADGLALAAHLRHLSEVVSGRTDLLAERLAAALGRLLHRLDDLQGARLAHLRAATLAEQQAGPDHPRTARRLRAVGAVLRDLGDLPAARDALTRALAIYERLPDTYQVRAATVMHDLGIVLRRIGDLAGARAQLERALAIYEHSEERDSPDMADVLTTLANVLRILGQFAQARPLLEQALAIYEQAYGPDTPNTARTRHSLGLLLEKLGDLSGACAQLERALASYTYFYGPAHSATATTLAVLGQMLFASGDLHRARSCLKQAIAVDEQVYGRDHPETAPGLVRLGQILLGLGDTVAARDYALRAATILDHAEGAAADPFYRKNTLARLGSLLRDLGEPLLARTYLTRALEVSTRALGEDHPETVALQTALAALDSLPPPPPLDAAASST